MCYGRQGDNSQSCGSNGAPPATKTATTPRRARSRSRFRRMPSVPTAKSMAGCGPSTNAASTRPRTRRRPATWRAGSFTISGWHGAEPRQERDRRKGKRPEIYRFKTKLVLLRLSCLRSRHKMAHLATPLTSDTSGCIYSAKQRLRIENDLSRRCGSNSGQALIRCRLASSARTNPIASWKSRHRGSSAEWPPTISATAPKRGSVNWLT